MLREIVESNKNLEYSFKSVKEATLVGKSLNSFSEWGGDDWVLIGSDIAIYNKSIIPELEKICKRLNIEPINRRKTDG